MNKENKITVKACASGAEATSGKIIAIKNGVRKEIPAVVFSPSETQRLFRVINKPKNEAKVMQ